MSQVSNGVTSNASMNESNPDVTQSSTFTEAPLIDLASNVVTCTQNPTIHDTNSVFDITEPSINRVNQMPRKRAKSLSYESDGSHRKIPPLHGESKNAPCLYTEVTRDVEYYAPSPLSSPPPQPLKIVFTRSQSGCAGSLI